MTPEQRYQEFEQLRTQADTAFAAVSRAASELREAVAQIGFLQTGLWQAYTRAATARVTDSQ